MRDQVRGDWGSGGESARGEGCGLGISDCGLGRGGTGWKPIAQGREPIAQGGKPVAQSDAPMREGAEGGGDLGLRVLDGGLERGAAGDCLAAGCLGRGMLVLLGLDVRVRLWYYFVKIYVIKWR